MCVTVNTFVYVILGAIVKPIHRDNSRYSIKDSTQRWDFHIIALHSKVKSERSHYIAWKVTVPLTHLPLDKMVAISQATFANAFSRMKSFVFQLIFHWNVFLRMQINNVPALVQIMVWRCIGDNPLSEPMLTQFMTQFICGTKWKWVKLAKINCHWYMTLDMVLYEVYVIFTVWDPYSYILRDSVKPRDDKI